MPRGIIFENMLHQTPYVLITDDTEQLKNKHGFSALVSPFF